MTTVERAADVAQWPLGHPVLVERWGCQCPPDAVRLSCPLHTVTFTPPGSGRAVVAVRWTRTPEPVEEEPEWDWIWEEF